MIFTYFHKAVYNTYYWSTIYRHHSNHYKTDYLSIYHLGVFPFRTRAVVIRSRVPLISFPNVVQDWLAYIHTKACFEALLHLQHRKCLDPSNFVLHFVKRLFKPPCSSNNSYIGIEGLWWKIPDIRSHLFKFPTKVIKVHAVEILLSVIVTSMCQFQLIWAPKGDFKNKSYLLVT